ncbi:hypothetical protein GCM10011386_25330 [Parapedobacter defluvii]|uniref:Alpha glucuronidase N-terminal domain-containing protein n=1 Tax=Parapedobacter defluvii TaxID=2045106 RepID=A0ABQ1M1K2_9SPHI|nr:DUF4838 domain-containing protein [Parapedobacter defluvii]GGC32145.1 hypothetical protein GCM10011386_25330 [Parapedobacter defluvii]
MITRGTLFLFIQFIPFILSANQLLQLANHGRSAYQIRISSDASALTKHAADEFQRLFEMRAGVSLPLVTGTSASDKEVVIREGSTGLLETERTLGQDGFVIKVEKNRLIIDGGGGKGILYGVYSFFEKYLGYRCYEPQVLTYPKRRRIVLPATLYDVQQPQNSYRNVFYHVAKDPFYRDWHKLDQMQPDWGLWVHTFSTFIPAGKYFATHPEYFALVDGKRRGFQDDPHLQAQLCLSNREVRQLIVEKLSNFIRENPYAEYWSVSQNDTYAHSGYECTCEECAKIDSITGSPSGSLVTFVNDIAKQFPNHVISTLAYRYSRRPPQHLNLDSNVNIMLCTIECDRQRPIATDSLSADFRKDFEGWGKLTDNIIMWDYVVQFSNLYAPFPNLRTLQPNIQYFNSHGVHVHFQQGNITSGGEFAELRPYLIAKLLWDPEVDISREMTDFLNGYYGKAGRYIDKYIQSMHNLLDESNIRLTIYGAPEDHLSGFLSTEALQHYGQLFDRAERKVASDAELLERVKIARMPLTYALLEIAKKTGVPDGPHFLKVGDSRWRKESLVRQLEEFYSLCNKKRIPYLKENAVPPLSYYMDMKAFLMGDTTLPSDSVVIE